jgi:hypothetical protein
MRTVSCPLHKLFQDPCFELCLVTRFACSKKHYTLLKKMIYQAYNGLSPRLCDVAMHQLATLQPLFSCDDTSIVHLLTVLTLLIDDHSLSSWILQHQMVGLKDRKDYGCQ